MYRTFYLFFVCLLLWPAMAMAQPASDPDFSERLGKVAAEFEWVSTDDVRDEAQDIWRNHKNELSQWALRISEMHGLVAGLKSAQLPVSLMYLPAALGVSGHLLPTDQDRNGPWKQFAPVAAKYGLMINPWIDQRLDPELSAQAAVRQLAEVWSELKPASLAVLAFLSSPANVRQAQYRSCDALSCRSVFQGMEASTLRVYHRFLAVVYLYAFHRELIPSQALLPSNKIQFHVLEHAEPLAGYLNLLGEDPAVFQKQNPHLLGNVIPKGSRVYSRYAKPEKTLSEEELGSFGFQRCNATSDSLLGIMRQIKTDPNVWLEANGVESFHFKAPVSFLLPNAVVAQHKPEKMPEELPLAPSYREPQKPKPEAPNKSRFYVVKSGDTLWSIARKYGGVTHTDIQKANRLGSADQIKIGQKLKIPQ
jgi:membrane-bound lytic murein transglycosylase D